MSKINLNKGVYSSDYSRFFENDLWPFVGTFLSITENLSPHRQYFLAGNGASAAIASHIANDFTKSLGCRARTFHDPAHITCFANDYGYENWLAESIRKFADEGDVVILISSSGRSENILIAAEAAAQKNVILVTLTGPSPDLRLEELANCHLSVYSNAYNIIECCHMIALSAAVDSVNLIALD